MRGTGRVKQRDRLKGESAHTAGLLSRHPPYECLAIREQRESKLPKLENSDCYGLHICVPQQNLYVKALTPM